MKTLDEVIKALEICTSDEGGCEGCPYDIDDCKPDKKWDEALHYLREYKKYTDTMCALPDYYEWVHSTDNPPITWDELHTMDGKPVWTTFDNKNGTWCIAKVYDDEVVLYSCGQEFGEILSGAWDYTPKRWQAYRKERE